MRGTFARAWNIAVRTRGVFTHRAGFHEARVRKKGPGAHGTALGRPGLVRTASQLFSGKLGANHITSTKSHAPIKPAAPATSHTNPHQPHLQHQKLRANQAGSPGNTTHQQHHQRHINRITNARNHAPIKPATPATPHINPQQPHQPHQQHQKPRANQASSPSNTTHQPHQQLHPRQRFLYCDGETPNISLKYFAKYFCVPKPTASETSTTLSPASADNSWAALLSRMVRMNTEGFIP